MEELETSKQTEMRLRTLKSFLFKKMIEKDVDKTMSMVDRLVESLIDDYIKSITFNEEHVFKDWKMTGSLTDANSKE